MGNAYYKLKRPENEPVLSYKIGSQERINVEKALNELKATQVDIPLIIGGKSYYTDEKLKVSMPHDHNTKLGTCSVATEEHIDMAIEAALSAKKIWEDMPWEHRVSIFLKAADLAANKYRYKLNAATMLCQSKSVYQAEIDAACELVDFFRFSAYYTAQIYEEQASSSGPNWNRVDYRSLEGFVYAVSPFNFTAIGANLVTAPAIVGNVLVWKPARTAVYSNYVVMQILMEAGMPDGVINFIPGKAGIITDRVIKHRDFGGIHYTGSTAVFNSLWKKIAENLDEYKSYPRIVGETGGKNFVFAHKSSDIKTLSIALLRGAYEYQGQKCSAASRAFIPESIWPELKELLCSQISTIEMGDVCEFSNFMNAVIDEKSFDKIEGYIERAKASDVAEIVCGGGCSKEKGYFVEPTLIKTTDPNYESMKEEIFGPVLTVFIYPDDKFYEYLKVCDKAADYALTGAIFAKDRNVLHEMESILRNSAGNIYINDKPTGAVVDQQPFGGARKSGTNDKAGSTINMKRWLSPRVIKENFDPPTDYRYPFMDK